MARKLEFKHRQPRADWGENIESFMISLPVHIGPAALIAQELLDAATNLSIAKAPSTETVDELIHKSMIVRDYLLDVYEMLD